MEPSVSVKTVDDVSQGTLFTMHGIRQATHNLLRHAVFKDVEILAVDNVTFIQYDGPLESEMISHRLGQLPVRFLHSAAPDASTATFELHVVAPPRTMKAGITWVTSKSVVCTSGDAEVVHYRSNAEEMLAEKDAGFLLVPLHPGERVHISMKARVSTGREATRWVSSYVRAAVDPFSLYIETTGAITSRDALQKALQLTIRRLSTLSKDLDGQFS